MQSYLDHQIDSGKVKLVFLYRGLNKTWTWREEKINPRQWDWALALWGGRDSCDQPFGGYTIEKFLKGPEGQIYFLYLPEVKR